MLLAPVSLAVYLTLSLIPLFAGGLGPVTITVASLHLACAWALWRLGTRSKGKTLSLRSWVPILLIPLLYAELPLLLRWTGPTYFDARLVAWEALLFPSDPSATLAGMVGGWAGLLLSELLHAAYLSYYALIFFPLILLHARHQREAFHRTSAAVILAFLACCAIFSVFPVQGPRYVAGGPAGVSAGPFRTLALTILEAGSSRGAAFPSSHAAVAVAHSVMALRYQPRVGGVVALIAVGLGVGAVFGGFHYAIDIVAGVGVGGVCAAIAMVLPGGLPDGGRVDPESGPGVRDDARRAVRGH